MSTGGGYRGNECGMSSCHVRPTLSPQNVILVNQSCGSPWAEAGKDEKQLSEERVEYYQGVPAITIIVDGGWSKRSHKHSYNANSGVGIISGKAMRKLLYLGVHKNFFSLHQEHPL